jgi:hypothetical protein
LPLRGAAALHLFFFEAVEVYACAPLILFSLNIAGELITSEQDRIMTSGKTDYVNVTFDRLSQEYSQTLMVLE